MTSTPVSASTSRPSSAPRPSHSSGQFAEANAPRARSPPPTTSMPGRLTASSSARSTTRSSQQKATRAAATQILPLEAALHLEEAVVAAQRLQLLLQRPQPPHLPRPAEDQPNSASAEVRAGQDQLRARRRTPASITRSTTRSACRALLRLSQWMWQWRGCLGNAECDLVDCQVVSSIIGVLLRCPSLLLNTICCAVYSI